MKLTRAEFRFDDGDDGPITVQCIFRGGVVREFAVIFENRTVRLGRFEVGSNVWACEAHARRAITAARNPKNRRTAADARAERLRNGAKATASKPLMRALKILMPDDEPKGA